MDNIKVIKKAVDVLQNGGIIIYPTDTAFGIGCLSNKPNAVERLFKIRNRPQNQAFTMLVSSNQMALKYFKGINKDIKTLMDKYWPGGLTIVYYCNKELVDRKIRANGDTVGIRIPNHKTTLSIIEKVNTPLLGPSANFHGEKTPFKIEEINPRLISQVDYVVPGVCYQNNASTVVDATQKPFKILRAGAVQIEEIA